MRATVEYHGIDSDYPPIKVVIADGSDNEDVIIKVSDEGGGIPRSNMKRIWSYVSLIVFFFIQPIALKCILHSNSSYCMCIMKRQLIFALKSYSQLQIQKSKRAW